MRKARFTEHQIITDLKSIEAGRSVSSVRGDELELIHRFYARCIGMRKTLPDLQRGG